jgi:hypothetical protein
VVLSGDIHALVVSGLNRVATDLSSPVVAAEFCGTSVSSHGVPQQIFDECALSTRTCCWLAATAAAIFDSIARVIACGRT